MTRFEWFYICVEPLLPPLYREVVPKGGGASVVGHDATDRGRGEVEIVIHDVFQGRQRQL